MKHCLPIIHFLFSVVFVCALTGCSSAFGPKATPEAKATVIAVANNYLNAILSGDERAVAYMVDWPTYVGDGDSRITREEYLRQFRSIQKRWPNELHPLIGLKLDDVVVHEDSARLIFERPAKTLPNEIRTFREVEIELGWNGNGWVVRADSLFGKHGLFSNLPPKQVSPPGKKS